jgi:TPP-dependent 2-oxoacid decarboxylase
MERPEHDLMLYLKYADEVEQADPIMALYCRLYFVEHYVHSKKKQGTSELSPDEVKLTNDTFNKIEKVQKESKLTKEQKQERVRQYCAKMYQKIMELARSPGANITQCTEMLQTMINFISILATFGPLTAEWVNKCKYLGYYR